MWDLVLSSVSCLSHLLSLFLSVQRSGLSPCFFYLSSLIFCVQFVSTLPIECGCLICMQGSNYSITCEYSSVTIIQVRIEGIACSLEQLLRQYSPRLNVLSTFIIIDQFCLYWVSYEWKHTRHTKHIFLSHILWVFNFKWLTSVPCGNVFKICLFFAIVACRFIIYPLSFFFNL